jgi:hypothetical protein
MNRYRFLLPGIAGAPSVTLIAVVSKAARQSICGHCGTASYKDLVQARNNDP